MLNKEKRQITATLTAKAPITHGAFSDVSSGNSMMFRRVPVVSLPGFPPIPVVSGNAIRGVVRRTLMQELYEAIGFKYEWFVEQFESEQIAKRSWDKLYAALFNGGTLLGKLEDSTDPDELRHMRKMVPALSVLGSSLYMKMLPGMARIGFAWLICKESIDGELVEKTPETIVISAEDAITEIGQVRHIERENNNPEITGVTPMPVTIEALAPGASLQFRASLLPQTTEIERSCLVHGLSLIHYIGGKGATGFGEVSMALSDTDDSEYVEWLQGDLTQTRDYLLEMARSFK